MAYTFYPRVIILSIIILIILIIIIVNSITSTNLYNKNINCYRHKSDFTLPSIMKFKPAIDKSIFFHETSCSSEKNDKITITMRQACAVESAAKQNPNFEVNLIFLSPGIVKNEGTESDRLLQVLQSYENIKLRYANFEEYVAGTPVENLWKSGQIEGSNYVLSHVSDVLRYLTLWKYGGIYLDLDVIVINSLEYIPFNYAGAQSESVVAAGVLRFEATGAGHALVNLCLDDLKNNFDGKDWANNGPGVITRLAKDQCSSATVEALIGKTCAGNFKVFPPETFYPVAYDDWKMYFNKKKEEQIKELSKNSYAIHMWNKLSFGTKIRCGARLPYALFAEQYCPEVYKQCIDFF